MKDASITISLPIFLLILITFNNNINAQSAHPFIIPGKEWVIKIYDVYGGVKNNYDMQILGDTIVDGFQASVIDFSDGEPSFLLRESDSLVYLKRPSIDSNFILLYDFTLTLGDTFSYPYYEHQKDTIYNLNLVVTDVDSFLTTDNEKRKSIFLESIDYAPNSCPFDQLWIDGMGSNFYPFYIGLDCFESNPEVRCYTEPNEQVYGSCGPDNINNLIGFNLDVFPNPFFDILTISTELDISKIEVINLQGATLKIGYDIDALNLSNIAPGIYFLKIESSNGLSIMKKIVKKG